MSAEQLFETLKRKQVELWCQGKMLRFRAPENALDEAMMAELRKYKSELIEIVRREAQSKVSESRLEPSTIGQQAMYFLHLSAPYSPAYNVASACRIRSLVNVDAMREALHALIARHDALRTTLEMTGGRLQRRVHNQGELDFAVLDTQGLDAESLKASVHHEYQRPFDLGTGPLMRVRLFSAGETDHVFLIVLHHIVFDAWSLWLVQEEFHALYMQHAVGKTAELPPIPASYTDFVREQEALPKSPRGEQMWEYWSEQLGGEIPSLNLPVDHTRPHRPGLRGATHKFRISNELTSSLRELAKTLHVTPFALMLAIFKLLLHRYGRQEDMTVGTTTSGRSRTDFTRVVGYFVNTLAIRSDLSGDPTFAEYAAQVKKRVLEAIKHQDYPFPALIDRLSPRRDSGRAPICNVMFGLQKPRFSEAAQLFNEQASQVEIGGWEIHPFELNQQEGQFDLTLEMFETQDSFLGVLKYDVELFKAETAQRIGEHYLQLAKAIVAAPDQRISEYDLVSDAERQEILAFSRGGPLPVCEQRTAHGLFEQQAAAQPDATALICNEQRWTYDALNREANQLARVLQTCGVEQGTLVACCFDRGLDTARILLAILKAGGVYTPLDPANPPQRLANLVSACGAEVVISDKPLPQLTDGVRVVTLAELHEESSSQRDTDLNLELSPDALAYVLHTSGSTGVAKGVCVSHEAFALHTVAVRESFGLRSDDRVLQFSNLTFDPSLEQMFAPWSLGGTVVMRGNELWSPEQLWENVRRWKLTMVNLPPAYFKHCHAAITDQCELDSLRLLILGGDVFPVEALGSWRQRDVQVLNAYGPTEGVITAAVYDASDHDPRRKNVPIGRPRPGARAYVSDSCGNLAPIGVCGELCLGGPMLATGYLNDPALTAEKFVADPFSGEPGARMYRTGDTARWTVDGQLEFFGREDRQIKIHGMRVETGEIEATINACPGALQAHVATRTRGENTDLIAWVVSDGDDNLAEDVLLSRLQTILPRYMLPRQIVSIDEMPLNTSGKVDEQALPEPPSILARSKASQYLAPRTPWEMAFAKIWSEELNVDPVGIRDNFFDLGGASLSSLRIVSRANEEKLNSNGEPLQPEVLFEYPTIGELAAYLGHPSPQINLATNE